MTARALGVLASLLLGACGSDGAQGPQGPAGPAGPGDQGGGGASINGLNPPKAFLGRKVDVTISGFGTAWTKDTKPAFGEAITVDEVQLASPTALVASITIADTAATGPRDVKVDGLTYAGGFKLESPVRVSTEGTLAQGSIVQLHATNLDLAKFFDTTQAGDPLAGVTFPNVTVTASGGITPQVNNVTEFAVDMSVTLDVTAPTGPVDVALASGPKGARVSFPAPKAITIAPRAPVVLAAGTPANGTIADPYDSAVYQFTPGASLAITDVVVTSQAGAQANPRLFFLPKTGKFADLMTAGRKKSFVTSAADVIYGVYWDSTGTTGTHAITVSSPAGTLASAAASATSTTSASAQPIPSVPYVVTGAQLASATTELWASYTAVAGDMNKKLHVQTVGGDWRTDTVIDVLGADGKTSKLQTPVDLDYHEDVSVPITAAELLYVHITASAQFNDLHKDYVLVVRVD
jgi:hypothetical protein